MIEENLHAFDLWPRHLLWLHLRLDREPLIDLASGRLLRHPGPQRFWDFKRGLNGLKAYACAHTHTNTLAHRHTRANELFTRKESTFHNVKLSSQQQHQNLSPLVTMEGRGKGHLQGMTINRIWHRSLSQYVLLRYSTSYLALMADFFF